jgi:hypothetical protein
MALNIPSLVVSAVTTFDGKALAKGQKQISSFDKSVKSVAKSLGVAFSATAVVAFGKASVKAFAEDEKAAARLSRTVTNLGLSFENTRITKFIGDLEKTANVADDVLRPAFSSLLTTTGSVEKSQKLLALALDVSAGSGEDVATVANDLSLAYVGNTRGLAKYRLGLTKAELAGKSFNEVQDLISKQFAGQNAARLDTYEGKIAAVGVAFGNLQETVGEGLTDAFAILAGDGGIEGATTAMETFGESSRDVLVGTASYVDKLLDKLKGFSAKGGGVDFLAFIPIIGSYLGEGGVFDKLAQEGRRATGKDKQFGGRYADLFNEQKEKANAKARAKAEADAAKRAKELLALQKKSAQAEKNKISLSKAAAAFDSTRIGLAAALQATYDKETKLRLEALMLIEEDKGEEALKKITQLANFQKSADLQRLAGVQTISNATLDSLNTQLLTEITNINRSKIAEGEKELAREEAFKKYNAAITAAGSLAAKESYNERVQIQLTEIAKLAAISNTYNAQRTAALLLESSELSMIDRVSKAQAEADAKRLAALKEYQANLDKIGLCGPGGGSTFNPYIGPKGGIGTTTISPTVSSIPAVQATFEKVFTDMAAMGNNQTQSAILALSSARYEGLAASYANYSPGNTAYNPISSMQPAANVTINAGIGDPEAIARAVEDVLNQSTYRGTSVNRGSGRYYE